MSPRPAPASLDAAPAPGAETGLFYRGMRGLVRTSMNVFYRTIEVTGREHLDPTVPTILACNHPNSIVDPLLLALFEERQVCFCARDGLFHIPGFGSLLRAVGAVPLKRRSDHDGGAVDNAGAFAACRAVLERGGTLAIFPEGKTHERLRIEPLKTGAARIALDAAVQAGLAAAARGGAGAASRPASKGVRIVPVGITYLVRHAFLSDVHVAIGPPIDVAAFAAGQADGDAAGAVRALTGRVEQAIRDLVLHIDEAEDERLIAQVTAIVAGIRADEGLDEGGQSPAERTALARRVVEAHHWILAIDPFETALLRQRIETYMAERRRLGLGGERPTLQHRGERGSMLTGWRWLTFVVLCAPLAAYGLATSLVPYVLLRTALRLARPSTDRVALFKLLGGALSFGLCFAAETAVVVFFLGPLLGTLFGLSLLPAAFLVQRYVTQTRLHRLQLRSATVFFRSVRMEILRAQRRGLAAELAELRTRYLAHVASADTQPASGPTSQPP